MKYMPLEDIKLEAKVSPVLRETPRTRRRRRLERLATLLERHHGTVNLLSGIEYTTYSARLRLRADDSPLALAYSDPLLRQEGLDGDTLGDAVIFFDLAQGEAHHLFCDCHYPIPTRSEMVGARARSVAAKLSFREMRERIWRLVAARLW